MRRPFPRPLTLAVLLALVAAVGLGRPAMMLPPSVALGPSDAYAAGAVYQETFTGRPAGPTPYRPSGWDVLVHSRDVSTWQQLEGMAAGHGPDCAAHPASHPVSQYEDTVFQCNDHLMTALNASGYGAIYLTPSQILDFSTGEATVRFDLSTFRNSQRDWIDIWITPYDDNLPAPLDSWLPDLTGLPRRGVHIRMDQFNGATIFRGDVIQGFTPTEVPSSWWTGYESFLTPSAVRRDPFELRISQGSLKFGMPTYGFWWIDTAIAPLD